MAVALGGGAAKGCTGCGMRMGEEVLEAAREEALWDPCPESLDPGYPDAGDDRYDGCVDGVVACSGYEGKNVQRREKKRFASRCSGRQFLSLCRHCSLRVRASSDCHRKQLGQSQVGS